MFGLFRKKAKKTEVEPENVVIHDSYEVFRMMGPEDLEKEARSKDEEANKLAVKWNEMNDTDRDENMDMYYQCLNLRKEAEFFRQLKYDFNARVPDFFECISKKESHTIQPYVWRELPGKRWNKVK